MNHFRERIRRLRTGLMVFLLMLGSMFGVLTPAIQAYAAEPTITGTCHIEVDDLGANTGGSEPYTTFFVTMPDGQTYHGECIDHGSYIPLAGDYPFTGTWNGTRYDIIVESRYFADTREDVCPEERPNFDLYGQGYTQRVGNFTYMPYGYVRIVKQSADPAFTDGNAMYSLAGAEFTVTSQDGSVLGTLTTGEDGTTGTLEVPAGQTVTIR
ncbi:SpaA isopeptide-forming pilin-related protein, partial [uncultured Bifidobacterium sp.]|uniref:SpaA isopeptide-forming pilin-related protein n=1 Tax=uncultured Bifidobacterium sp. TaxID=165187 RepID=UPI0025920946